MTRKTLLVAGAGAIALAITTTSLITKLQPTAVAKPVGVTRQARSSHYPWHNSYKAVVDQTAAVAEGIVTGIEETYDEREGPRTLVTLSQLLVLWGESLPPNVTLKLFGGRLPSRGRVDEVHIPKFVMGKRYLVFLSNRDWRLSPVTAHQAFIIERVQNKDVLVTTDGYAVYGIDDATGPIRQFPVYLIPDEIDDNFIPEIAPRITTEMVAGVYSPEEFASSLRTWAARNSVSVSGSFNDQPFVTGNWRVNKAVPDREVGSDPRNQFEPPPGPRKEHDREQTPCSNRTTPTDSDPRDRSPLCPEGGNK
jgi:hypothetical protein